MDQPGRKSAENLSVIVNIPGQRLEPPEVLSDAERSVWRRVVATRPADWFQADMASLLVEYCRAWVAADQVAEALGRWDGVPQDDDQNWRLWFKLRDRQEKTARLLKTLAAAMRLTPQSRYTPLSAATAARKTAPAKPWEYGNAG